MKRTKKQKIEANARRVNTQFTYEFNKAYDQDTKVKSVKTTAVYGNLGSIKNELLKSIVVAVLILISLVVVYWFS